MVSIILTPVGFQRRAGVAVLQCLHATTLGNSGYRMSQSPMHLRVAENLGFKLSLAPHLTHKVTTQL